MMTNSELKISAMPCSPQEFACGDIVEVIFNVATSSHYSNKQLFNLKLELKGLLLCESKHRKVGTYPKFFY
jgi:hypothetical protein